MSNELERLEIRLREMKPRPLPKSLAARIRSDIEAPGAARRASIVARMMWWGGVGLAAAASVLFLLGTGVNRANPDKSEPVPELVKMVTVPPVPIPEDVYRLVSAETYVLDQHNEGAVTNTRGEPALKVRYRCVDRVQWHNPCRHSTFVTTSPREEVRMVSMETH